MPYQGEPIPETTPVLVSGWGETRNEAETSTILRAVILEVSNQQQCSEKYKRKSKSYLVLSSLLKFHPQRTAA
jgi:Trypsin